MIGSSEAMRITWMLSLVLTTIWLPSLVMGQSEIALHWSELPPLPGKIGFAGPFAGAHNGVLMVGGGANFPGKMPWEGGNKVWHEDVFVLDSPDGTWKVAGKLPRPLGYGVSLSTDQGLVCLGGSDSQQHYDECFVLRWDDGTLITSAIASLPKPCANFCGAILNNTLYVAGGIETPTATVAMKSFWSLDLRDSNSNWKELETWPGPPRMLAVAAVQDNAFYVVGGASLTVDVQGKPVRKYEKDAYRYRVEQGWTRVADLPRPVVAAPTPAPTLGLSRFLVMGGDDGMHINFMPPALHPGFPKSILAYDTILDAWGVHGQVPASHVTTTVVPWRGGFVIPSGEIRPGVRSTSVWFGQPKK